MISIVVTFQVLFTIVIGAAVWHEWENRRKVEDSFYKDLTKLLNNQPKLNDKNKNIQFDRP